MHQPSQNRTIPCFAPTPLPLNERSVGFASALSPRPAPPHLPPLPKVRCCRPKKFGRLPEGLPHHHPSLAPTLPKPHYPLLCTITLASLVKGRWIDGKAQALILLLSACDMPTIFMLQTFCRQDGGIAQQPFAPHNLPNTHYPTLSTTFLPPLLKVRCCRLKKFGRLPEGLHNNPSPRITSQIRTIPCFAPSHLPPLLKVRCSRPKKFGRLPEGLSLHQPFPKPHYHPRFS